MQVSFDIYSWTEYKSPVKDREPSSQNPRINRRQAIALGLTAIGLGDEVLLRKTKRSIDKKVSQAEAMQSHTPSVADTYAGNLKKKLYEETYSKERTNVDLIALIASAGVLFMDRHLSRHPLPDSQED